MDPTPRAARIHAILGVALAVPCGLACDREDQDDRYDARPAAEIPAPAFPSVTDSIIAAGPGTDWPGPGGDLANTGFSPLGQIHRGNVADLVPVWIHSTGIEGALETSPVVVGNTLYATTAGGRVLALNAATGERLWEFDPEPATVTLCCGPVNRGVSVWGDHVYVASLDARLIALDARSGAPAWEVELADPEAGNSATMAPLAAGGRVFVGVSGERYGIRGFVAAFDARSGEELWRWRAIPADEDEGGGWWGEWRATDPFGARLNRDIEQERADSAVTSSSWNVGGGGVATTPAYDPQSGLLFVNVEGPAPLMWGAIRPGDNLYTGSIVAIEAGTGVMAWYAQYLPADVWGLSGGSPPFLFDRGGERYVGFAGRTGWVYVFNATTGEPVLRSDNFVPQEAMFTRPNRGEGARVAPGLNGGNPGTPVAVDRRKGTVFVGGVHQPMVYAPASQPYMRGRLWLGGEVRFPPGEAHWGTVTAIDLADGRILWQRQTPAPVHSGVLATAGDLVFVGQGTGTLDAFDATDGRLLWQFGTGAGFHGTPVSYSVGSVQYIVAAAGGSYHFGTPAGDDIIAFALSARRPATGISDYPATVYARQGPASPGRQGVRQLRPEEDTVGVDSPRAPR